MTAVTLTLRDFLLARIAEDEDMGRLMAQMLGNVDMVRGFASPHRALADLAAKRRIVELHKYYDGSIHDGVCCWVCADQDIDGEKYGDWPCQTLALLALPYASHPDYNPAWRL